VQLPTSEEAASSVTMMPALHAITEGTSDLPETSIADLRERAPDLITYMVLALNRWTKGVPQTVFPPADGALSPSSAPVRSNKVGRNDPCPCGSGRKYKRCCGAN
jgi:uncharacterized protein YecA (UPF0149 family)